MEKHAEDLAVALNWINTLKAENKVLKEENVKVSKILLQLINDIGNVVYDNENYMISLDKVEDIKKVLENCLDYISNTL